MSLPSQPSKHDMGPCWRQSRKTDRSCSARSEGARKPRTFRCIGMHGFFLQRCGKNEEARKLLRNSRLEIANRCLRHSWARMKGKRVETPIAWMPDVMVGSKLKHLMI
eukprot:g56061.t1